jgi:DNA-binding MarR family transcriptional regulator
VDDETLGAWRALLNLHAGVTAEIGKALAEAGLPPLSWYDALWPLRRAPGRRLRMGALAEQVTLSRTGLIRLVDRLEAAELIARTPAPEDRRGSYVVLTKAGAELLRRMWPVYERVLEERFAPGVERAHALRLMLEHAATAHQASGESPSRCITRP